ncbi:MAG: HNH endonuclease [Treponema sp.]|nr:HNH endonuclease [Treponema sp.]
MDDIVHFSIERRAAQDSSPSFDSFITDNILRDIAKRIFNTERYTLEWIEQRNVGRTIICSYNSKIAFVTLSPFGKIQGRNYFFQSIPTSFGRYVSYIRDNKVSEASFYFYFLPLEGNIKTDYYKFMFKLMQTASIKLLNADVALGNYIPQQFFSVKEIIKARNVARLQNSANNSTYVTDEGDEYHIYGKTFGANSKETVLLCIAMSFVSEKPIKLFQILDNDSETLTSNDISTIKTVNSNLIEIIDDSYTFDNDVPGAENQDKLRSPRFIYNLFVKYGNKKCVLCDCSVECIIQGAHIYSISSIRKNTKLNLEEKQKMAIDGDNGLWLCENHHKLFDTDTIWFDESNLSISTRLNQAEIDFINQITPYKKLKSEIFTEKTQEYILMRNHNSGL